MLMTEKKHQSNYFYLSEFERSETAERLRINNKIPPELIKYLDRLIVCTLNPARKKFGRRIIVNSGYRCKKLNIAVGGVPTSLHLQARAADITVDKEFNEETHRCENSHLLKRLYYILKELPHTELILYSTFIHVAL